MQPSRIILASTSPRRQQLLAAAGYDFEVIPPSDDAESGEVPGESTTELVVRLAKQKAADVARPLSAGIILGCDTVADCEGKILGKPTDREHARQMLETLRGREHWVHSGLCLWRRPDDRVACAAASTRLIMDPISDAALDEYLDSGEWQGKAGAFGYQDGLDWVHILEGSASNVVGLPLELLARVLPRLQ
jgi:septum formation protein